MFRLVNFTLVISAPRRKDAIKLFDDFPRYRGILGAVAEIEVRLDARKERVRAVRRVGVKTAAVE